LLFKLAEKEEAAWIVASVVRDNFNKIPEEVRRQLLEKVRRRWTN